MSDAARNHWVSLKTIIDDFLHKAVPKYGTVGSVDSNGNLSIQLVEDDISSLEVYERIAGFDVFPGDQLVCLAMNPGLVALGKLQTAGAVPLALSAGLIGEVVYNGARTAGSEVMLATSLCILAGYSIVEGDAAGALPMLEESTRISLELGHLQLISASLWRFARILALEGHAEAAAQLLSASEALREEVGDTEVPWDREINDETRAMVRGRLVETSYAEASERGRRLAPEDAVALALDLG